MAQDPVAGPDATGKVFRQSILVNATVNLGLKMVEVQDPVSYYIIGDAGAITSGVGFSLAAYPEICCLECSGMGGGADWGDPDFCVLLHAPNDGRLIRDPELRKAYSRHLGGVNCGFLDGHAQWFNSTALVHAVAEGDVNGLDPWDFTYQEYLDEGYAPGEIWTLY
jgi:prepilin-type processing-associated H-X9-DG protein